MIVRTPLLFGLLLAVAHGGCAKQANPKGKDAPEASSSLPSSPQNEEPSAREKAPEPAPAVRHEPLAIPPGDETARLELVDLEDGIGNCGFDVLGRGLPAVEVHSDGNAAAVYNLFRKDIEVDEEQPMWQPLELQQLEPDGDVAKTDVLHPQIDTELDKNACAQLRSKLKQRLDVLNESLSSKSLRPMKELGVAFPSSVASGLEARLPARPDVVEMLYHARHFILRVPKVKVLAKQAQPQWRRAVEPKFGGPTLPDPDPVSLWVDPKTGLAVVYVTHGNPVNDHGDDAIHPRVTTLPPEAIAEVQARPYPYRHPLFHWDTSIRRSR